MPRLVLEGLDLSRKDVFMRKSIRTLLLHALCLLLLAGGSACSLVGGGSKKSGLGCAQSSECSGGKCISGVCSSDCTTAGSECDTGLGGGTCVKVNNDDQTSLAGVCLATCAKSTDCQAGKCTFIKIEGDIPDSKLVIRACNGDSECYCWGG